MLGAVRIPGCDGEENDLFRPRLVSLRKQTLRKLRIALDHLRFTPDLDTLAIGVVDEEEMRLRVFQQVTLGDVLTVSREVDEADRLVIEDFEEAGRTAAMLDIRLALGIRRPEKDARPAFDKSCQV